jgi:transposase-like protein
MTHHVFFLLLLCVLMFSLARLCFLCWPHHSPAQLAAAKRTLLHRLLKPRSPHDCPACRRASTLSPMVVPAPAPVRPWNEVKSRRGAPKRVNTQGYACPSRKCPYFGITDAHIHALVGDGKHGCAERIQTFRGPACHTTFTSRRNTPLYRLKTPSQQVAVVLSALAEGLDPSAAERVAGLSTSHHYQPFCHVLASTRTPCTSASSAISTSRTCSWTNCAPGCAAPHRCSGCGWPSTLAPRFFLCFSSVLEPKTWRIASSTPCDSSWLLAAFLSLRATG